MGRMLGDNVANFPWKSIPSTDIDQDTSQKVIRGNSFRSNRMFRGNIFIKQSFSLAPTLSLPFPSFSVYFQI